MPATPGRKALIAYATPAMLAPVRQLSAVVASAAHHDCALAPVLCGVVDAPYQPHLPLTGSLPGLLTADLVGLGDRHGDWEMV